MKTYKRGISLIVLVITVIVLAILATATIITLSNANIISEAGKTVNAANKKQVEEALQLAMASYMLDVKGGNDEAPTTVTEAIAKLNTYMPENVQISTDSTDTLTSENIEVECEVGDFEVTLSFNDSGTTSASSVTLPMPRVGDYVNYVAPAVNYTVLGTDSGMKNAIDNYTWVDYEVKEPGFVGGDTLDLTKIPHVDSTTGNQTFNTYTGRWQVLSVKNGTVVLINESSLGRFSTFKDQDSVHDNQVSLLNGICSQYADSTLVASSRSINYDDFVDGAMSSIAVTDTLRAPGYYYYLATVDNSWYSHMPKGAITDGTLYDTYIDGSGVCFWTSSDMAGIDGVGSFDNVGVRAVITLKSDLTFTQQSSLVNGKTMWDIN